MVAIPDPEKLQRAIERLRKKAARESAKAVIACPCCGAGLQVETAVVAAPTKDGGSA